jgi:hypothetical protein
MLCNNIINYHSIDVNAYKILPLVRTCSATLYNNDVEYDIYVSVNPKNSSRLIISCFDALQDYGFKFEISHQATTQDIINNCKKIIKEYLNITNLKVLSF